MIEQQPKKKIEADSNGLLTYSYIANNIDSCEEEMYFLLANMIKVDMTGQYVASAARYLYAINKEQYKSHISTLIASVIEKAREHRYLPGLIQGIWGDDYLQRAEELKSDDNFRRIYKRLYPSGM